MPKISAVIITYNEENLIERCLASLDGIVDEIVIVDSYSTDRTEEICKKYNAKFVQHHFEGFRDQKNYALSLATYDNILALDADEALSETLRESILAVKENWKFDGYKMNRRNYYDGKWIRFSEWYPDRQMRLFFADHGSWGELNLHEKFMLPGKAKIGKLKGDLLHWSFSSKQDHAQKMKNYSILGAQEYHKAGRKASFLTPYIHFTWGFFRSYIIRAGFLDGLDGLRICYLYANSAFHKYRLLRILNKQKSSKQE
jgi:glycosyltransferase involved in cell wall biosynthesis